MLFGLFQSKNKKSGAKAKPRQGSRIFRSYKPAAENPKSGVRTFPTKKENINLTAKEILQSETTKKNNKFFKIPDFSQFSAKNINLNDFWKGVRYFFFKYQISSKINGFLGQSLIAILIFTLFYLTFFDTFFLVKNYNFSFSEGSYLSEKETVQVGSSIRRNYFLGFVPNNQYWFLNERNLTESAKQAVPEIYEVKIKDRNWPNGANLEIANEPILVTLATTENSGKKYWRISQEGRVVTEDLNNIREKLVRVEQKVDFNQSGVTFQDYKLQENKIQLNRLWFITWVWQLLDSLKIPIRSTNLPTMTDTEVKIQTTSGTNLFFESDVEIIPREVMQERILTILKSTIRDRQDKGEITYIDFRIPTKKVFICYKGTTCDK